LATPDVPTSGRAPEPPANDQAAAQAPAIDDAADPELLSLPRPRKRRHPLISVAVILLSLYLMVFVRADLIYFFQPRSPTDLGQVEGVVKKGALKANTHVTVHGAPDRKHSLLLKGQFTGFDSFVPLLQSDYRVYVQRHRRERSSHRTVMGVHSGRVVPFDQLPYRNAVRRELHKMINIAHELDFDALVAAKHKGDRTIRDSAGRAVKIDDKTEFWINVSYPDEWVIQLSKKVYPTADQAKRALADLPLPYAQDAETSHSFWRFAVLARGEQLRQLLASFADPRSHSGVVRRQVTYTARWDQLAIHGDTLVIDTDDPALSVHYEEVPPAKGQTQGQLAAIKTTPVRVPRSSVRYLSTGSAFTMPSDAMVIVVGETPDSYWHYLLLFSVLGAFILFNMIALASRLKERSARG
jgi:hypothetical protein